MCSDLLGLHRAMTALALLVHYQASWSVLYLWVAVVFASTKLLNLTVFGLACM